MVVAHRGHLSSSRSPKAAWLSMEQEAPRVVAKGVDSLAARIREVAEENRVPVVANPPLARALYRVEVDADIPAEHYQAVAEIIAYVWRLARRPLAESASIPAGR